MSEAFKLLVNKTDSFWSISAMALLVKTVACKSAIESFRIAGVP